MAVTTVNKVVTNREDTAMTASRADISREVMVVTVNKAAISKVAINRAVVLAAVLQTPTSPRTSSTRDLQDTATKVLHPTTKARVNSVAQAVLMAQTASAA
jgi:hypothetical protein